MTKPESKTPMPECENGIESVLREYLHEDAHLPDTRSEFSSNMLPITPEDRALIGRKFGRQVADAVLSMQHHHAHNGGVNPSAGEFLFPDGTQGEMDLRALSVILANYLSWHHR